MAVKVNDCTFLRVGDVIALPCWRAATRTHILE